MRPGLQAVLAPTSGLVTRGLQGAWFLGRNQLLLHPAAFDNVAWTKTRSYVAANCAADPETGLYTVDKLVEDGTAASTHQMGQTAGTSVASDLAFLAKAGGRSVIAVALANGGAGAYFNLSTGTVGTLFGATARITDKLNGWYLCEVLGTHNSGLNNFYIGEADNDVTYSGLGHQGTAAAGGSVSTAVLAAGASAVDDVYNDTEIIFSDAPTTIHTVSDYVGATKTATFTPARASAPDATTYTVGPGIYIARAQLNAGTTLYPYEDRGDQQTIPIYRGAAGTLQRGATSGAEASDPGIANSGLTFLTDDYVLGNTLANLSMTSDFMVYVVLNGGAANAGTTVATIAPATTINGVWLGYSLNTTLKLVAYATTNESTSAITISDGVYIPLVFGLRAGGTEWFVSRLDTGATGVFTRTKEPSGVPRLELGSWIGGGAAKLASGIIPVAAVYNVAHTPAEMARNYKWLKAQLSLPPYSLDVL